MRQLQNVDQHDHLQTERSDQYTIRPNDSLKMKTPKSGYGRSLREFLNKDFVKPRMNKYWK